ncbi:MAG: PhzF family phenazine biosynthesis protein [Thiotrichales bacterium]
MTPSIFIVDAFADRPFTGNPAAVCLLEEAVESAWMQSVAAEMNLSETAFLLPQVDGSWSLRWFTPTVEVDLCGHATLASAHVLWEEFGAKSGELRFSTRSGELKASRDARGIELDFPRDDAVAAPEPPVLSKALGCEIQSVWCGSSDLLVVIESADQLRNLSPNLMELAAIPVRGVIVTAASDTDDCDFLSRFYAPQSGIAEDPVTGSAHCLLGPFWGQRLEKTVLRAYQASARGGFIGVEIKASRVRLSGKAITTLRGHLNV